MEITVVTAAPAVEAIANILLECRSGGVAEEATPSGHVLLRGYLPVGPATHVTLSAIKDRIRTLPGYGLDTGPATVETEEIEDEGWAHAWKIHFKPFPVGRLWITPTWDRTLPPSGAVVIELDPGMAFGSGLHPSTQMVLQLLSRLRGGETVFDVGTGSGILAIAAAKLGAGRVLARDNDPVAVEVARHNVAYNRVDDRVAVEEGDLLRGVDGQAHLILANLIADIHLDFLPGALPSLLPNGMVAASGIIADRVLEVETVARAAGFKVAESLRSGEWRCAILSRPGS
ncbi:MAG TPA: 50S ribosomal protein L11 methyltransferase [bacterium]|nr:50S ribosomal protein L11 methyltransferase [bacterium]